MEDFDFLAPLDAYQASSAPITNALCQAWYALLLLAGLPFYRRRRA